MGLFFFLFVWINHIFFLINPVSNIQILMLIEPLQPALALLGVLGPDSGPLQSETDCVPGTVSDKADESVSRPC